MRRCCTIQSSCLLQDGTTTCFRYLSIGPQKRSWQKGRESNPDIQRECATPWPHRAANTAVAKSKYFLRSKPTDATQMRTCTTSNLRPQQRIVFTSSLVYFASEHSCKPASEQPSSRICVETVESNKCLCGNCCKINGNGGNH